jgi:putative membrane protein
MIPDYRDHAANERTFLAWVRTGVAIIALGFVIEKFNLFVLTILDAIPVATLRHAQLERLSGSLGRYGGVALVISGLALIIVSTFRFARTERMLDDRQSHPAASVGRIELTLLALLVMIVAGFGAYMALD